MARPSTDGVMVSEDNVVSTLYNLLLNVIQIPLYDSIKSVGTMVRWMTRTKGLVVLPILELTPVYSFQIDNDNMEDLARLADKYIIDSLQNDVRVRPFDDPLTRLELHI